MAVVAYCHSGSSFRLYIAAHCDGIGGIGHSGHGHERRFYQMTIRISVVRTVGILCILRGGGHVAVFIQKVVRRVLIPGQFPILVNIERSRCTQNPGVVTDGGRTAAFRYVVCAYSCSATGVVGFAVLSLL